MSGWYVDYVTTLRRYEVTVVSNNEEWGSVSGGGSYMETSVALLRAEPQSPVCHFLKWSDDNTDNPRLVTVLSDTMFTAVFYNDTVPLSIQTLREQDVSIRPNPASSKVVISAPCEIQTLRLTDLNGREVYHANPQTVAVTIDAAAYPRGLYLVAVGTERGTAVKRLVLQ